MASYNFYITKTLYLKESKQDQSNWFYLEAGPEGLQEHHVGPLEVKELQLDSAAVVAAEAAGSIVEWAGGLIFALDLPGKSESDHWPWPRLAVALCDWGTQSCGGMMEDKENVR